MHQPARIGKSHPTSHLDPVSNMFSLLERFFLPFFVDTNDPSKQITCNHDWMFLSNFITQLGPMYVPDISPAHLGLNLMFGWVS